MKKAVCLYMAAALLLPLGAVLRADGRVIPERKLENPNVKYEQQLIQQETRPVAQPPAQPPAQQPAQSNARTQLLQEEQRSLNLQQEQNLRNQSNQWERRGYQQGMMEAQQSGAYGFPGYGYPMPIYQQPYNATPPDQASFKHNFPKQFGGEYDNFDDQGPEGFRPVYRPYDPGSTGY